MIDSEQNVRAFLFLHPAEACGKFFGMHTVFVYGTLKRGGTNHLFLTGQKYIGDATTEPGFALYSLGDYPGMVRAPGDTTGVDGELWNVDDACLAELDRLEGLAEGLYERVNVLLKPNAYAFTAQAYLYRRPHHGLSPVGPVWPVI